MSMCQKGIGRRQNTGDLWQLLKIIRLINLCIAWTDCMKACDSMPHICIQVHQDPKSLHQESDGDVANNTRDQLQANCISHHQVWHLQGDALSPLLCCIGLNILSQISNKT